MNNIIIKTFAIVVLAGMLASCAAVSGRETAGEYVDDATITAKVKTAIGNDPSLRLFQISVETFQNVVQLRGFVDSTKASSRAEKLAKVKGVTDVQNDIIVRKHKS